MKKVGEKEVYGVGNMSADKRVDFRVHLCDAENEATTWSITDTDRVANRLKREIYGIASNEQMRFMKELSICMIEFEAWWKAIGGQEIRKTIEQHVLHFGYPKMHLVSHISETIQ